MGGVKRVVLLAVTAALAAGCGARTDAPDTSAPSAPRAAALSLKRVVSGLSSPVHVAAPRNEPGRLYVVEQSGRILVVENGRLRAQPFLDIEPLVVSGGEQGLLSVAFHPRYAQNRRFYVDYTDTNGDTRVVEYRSDGRRAIPSSARQLLLIDQPYPNHNGGQLAFGPDGRLYVGMGDGGSGGDPEDRAQNPGSQLGKLLRLDPARPAGVTIAGVGLRNPWRFSFDRVTGDLYIGDVGQGSWEEIDFTPRSRLGATLNYGWDIYEGRARFEETPKGPGALVFPIVTYPLTGGNCAVTGGFVYRGRAVPAARGRYFYGDYCNGTIWSLKVASGKATQVRRERIRVPSISSFGEDAAGELYLVSHDGTIFRLAR
jgi:glucose/arabinose dehydrogenase